MRQVSIFTSSDPCDPNPCNGNGDCTVTADRTSYECSCYEGFGGDTCSIDKCTDANNNDRPVSKNIDLNDRYKCFDINVYMSHTDTHIPTAW